jgi:hypothetical protein
MGLDFIKKAARTFNKGLDKARITLGTPGLFRLQPGCVPQAYAVQLRADKALQSGEKVGVRLDGQNVLALRGFELVGIFKNPTPEVKAALIESHGEACGIVQTVHAIAGVAEVTLC